MLTIIKKLRLSGDSKSGKNGRRICNANFGAGFTLIELLVSFAILITGISSSINLISQSLKSSSYLRNQTTALYLAVEGIELIKNKRDENFLKGDNWLEGISGKCNPACFIDGVSGVIKKCSGLNCPNLKYDSANNVYNYNFAGGVETIFNRAIEISVSGGEREIISRVRWNDRFGTHNYVLRTSIFDWKP